MTNNTKNHEMKNWFFNEIDKSLAKLTKKIIINKLSYENWDIKMIPIN